MWKCELSNNFSMKPSQHKIVGFRLSFLLYRKKYLAPKHFEKVARHYYFYVTPLSNILSQKLINKSSCDNNRDDIVMSPQCWTKRESESAGTVTNRRKNVSNWITCITGRDFLVWYLAVIVGPNP